MTARIADIGRALAAAITAATLSESVTATFAALPEVELATTVGTPEVLVVPGGGSWANEARTVSRQELVLLVSVRCKLPGTSFDARWEQLVELVEGIAAEISRTRQAGVSCVSVETDPLYDALAMRERNQFEALVRATYRAFPQ